MILYCIRHGESEFNVEHRIQGQLDPPLSPTGRRQAEALACWARGESFDAVYSSPLARAKETAAPIAGALGLELVFDDRLRELNAGVFQGLRKDELNAAHPAALAGWRSQDPDFRIPGGESRRDLMIRGQAAFEEIRSRPHRRAIVVSHGGLLAGMLKALLGIPAQRNPFALYNGSISVLDWSGSLKLRTLNQTEHLQAFDCDLQTSTGDL